MSAETPERSNEVIPVSGAASKPPPFKRGALPVLTQPLVSALPSTNVAAAVEAPSTLLFNDVSDGALVCDPNDPDCEVV
ncbi:MAG: hypothetical protein EXR66_07515 [Dehalococcoidia bacterium]|nr:hypothetical protein [Dehalococcoidia bacterium]